MIVKGKMSQKSISKLSGRERKKRIERSERGKDTREFLSIRKGGERKEHWWEGGNAAEFSY